jgi:hypothetical protein
MNFIRLQVASTLLISSALATGCAIDATQNGAESDDHLASTSQAVTYTGGAIWRGTTLNAGDSVHSSNGHVSLTMQSDGNLVLYYSPFGTWSQAIWASNTGMPGSHAIMQDDGNFVIYAPPCTTVLGVPVCPIVGGGAALWATGTNPNGSYLWVHDNGNLTVNDAGSSRLWVSNSSAQVPDSAHCTSSFCAAGSWWHSCKISDGAVVCDKPCLWGFLCSVPMTNDLPSNSASLMTCSNKDGNLHCTSTTGTWNCGGSGDSCD